MSDASNTNNINKGSYISNLKGLINFAALCTLFTAPPVLVIGMGYLTSLSVQLLIFISLLIPILLFKIKRFARSITFAFNRFQYLYSWLFWCLFFALGTVVLNIDVGNGTTIAYIGATLIHMLVIFVFYLLVLASQWRLEIIRVNSDKTKVIPTTRTIAVYTLPIPLLLIGRFLYFDLNSLTATFGQKQEFQESITVLLNGLSYVLIILMMIVIVLYLYPRHESISKAIRYFRIFVTASVWLAVNAHLLYGYIPDWGYAIIYKLMPIFKESILVYVSPAIFEYITILIAVFVGLVLERKLIAIKTKS